MKEIKIEKKGNSFLAIKDGLRVGELAFSVDPKKIHLDLMKVEPNFRKKGIAKALIKKAIEYGRSLGKSKITAHVEGVEAPQFAAHLLLHDDRLDTVKFPDASIDEVIKYLKSVHPDEDLAGILHQHAKDLESAGEKMKQSFAFTPNWPSEKTFIAHGFKFVGKRATDDHGVQDPSKYIIIGSDGRIRENDRLSPQGVKLPALAISFFRLLYEKELE